ncbi:MAG: DUF4254 domain-containing protein [Bacteroidota bacterium]|nr:DUF4254 domain-containing protein [Bacteroidota bacterium]
MKTELFNKIFKNCIANYHKTDNVDQPIENPHPAKSLEALLYEKSWVDTVQWHLEDIIRDENIEPAHALKIKRRIDKSNQHRTDMVEQIDDEVFEKYKNTELSNNARLSTETAGWAIDRLSILNLKLYHMKEEADRENISEELRDKNTFKYNVLLQQSEDLSKAIDELIADMASGKVIAKTYKQMKMYNDPELNPVLRKQK